MSSKNKKAKKSGNISFRLHLTFVISILLILVIVSLLVPASLFMKTHFEKQIKDDISTLSKQVSETVRTELEDTESIVMELAMNPILSNKKFSEKEKVDFYMARAEELGYVLFFYITPDGMCTNLTPDGDKLDLSEMEYFKRSIKGEVFTTPIINDELTGEKIVIISAPYYENGEIAGVFAGIKTAEFLNSVCADFEWEESSTLAIIDEKENIVGHTNQELIKTTTDINELAANDPGFAGLNDFFQSEIKTKENGFGEYEFQGKEKVAGFTKIEERGYTALVSINRDIVFKPVRKLTQILIIISLISLTFGILLTYFNVSKKTARAFTSLKTDIEELANYNLNYTPVRDYSNRGDEIGDIYRATLSLKDNLRKIVTLISEHANNTAETSKQLTLTASNTSESAKEVSMAVGNIAEGATSQAHDTTSAAGNIEERTKNCNRRNRF